jgi:hypothetical protein
MRRAFALGEVGESLALEYHLRVLICRCSAMAEDCDPDAVAIEINQIDESA